VIIAWLGPGVFTDDIIAYNYNGTTARTIKTNGDDVLGIAVNPFTDELALRESMFWQILIYDRVTGAFERNLYRESFVGPSQLQWIIDNDELLAVREPDQVEIIRIGPVSGGAFGPGGVPIFNNNGFDFQQVHYSNFDDNVYFASSAHRRGGREPYAGGLGGTVETDLVGDSGMTSVSVRCMYMYNLAGGVTSGSSNVVGSISRARTTVVVNSSQVEAALSNEPLYIDGSNFPDQTALIATGGGGENDVGDGQIRVTKRWWNGAEITTDNGTLQETFTVQTVIQQVDGTYTLVLNGTLTEALMPGDDVSSPHIFWTLATLGNIRVSNVVGALIPVDAKYLDAPNQECEIWCLPNNISDVADLTVRVSFGNDVGFPPLADTDPNGRNAVWSPSYDRVFDMGELPTASPDRTGVGTDMVATGNVLAEAADQALWPFMPLEAADFNVGATNDGSAAAGNYSLPVSNTAFWVSGWIYIPPGVQDLIFLSQWDPLGRGMYVRMNTDGGGDSDFFLHVDAADVIDNTSDWPTANAGGQLGNASNPADVNTGFHKWDIIYDGAGWVVAIDGEITHTITGGYPDFSDGHPFRVCGDQGGNNTVDMVAGRIFISERAAPGQAFLRTLYRMHAQQATFLTLSQDWDEET
jgi:hypothetical protein